MKIVFVMDPVSTVLVDEDTTFALMEAAEARGHEVFHAESRFVSIDDGRVVAQVRRARCDRGAVPPISLGSAEEVDVAEVDVVFVRRDPPFDATYLWLTLALELVRGRTHVVNDPRGLRDANEKLYACHFPEVTPETLVSAERARIRAFVERVGGKAVLKPIDGHGGRGIFVVTPGDMNFHATFEVLSDDGRRPIMAQRYLPEVRRGDKRILLVDGAPIGAILRVPRDDDSRSNIHVGGRVVATELDDDDRRIVAAVAPKLRADGLFFVGLDVIGGRLTEVNVTSPTGIQQMMRLSGEPLAERTIEALERRVQTG